MLDYIDRVVVIHVCEYEYMEEGETRASVYR